MFLSLHADVSNAARRLRLAASKQSGNFSSIYPSFGYPTWRWCLASVG